MAIHKGSFPTKSKRVSWKLSPTCKDRTFTATCFLDASAGSLQGRDHSFAVGTQPSTHSHAAHTATCKLVTELSYWEPRVFAQL